MDTIQTKQFFENSRHALDHLFSAINEYNKALVLAQIEVEELENSEKALADLFIYRDQWSINANFHYAQYVERMKNLEQQKHIASQDISIKLDNALANIGATVDSMSSLAGSILQIAKQIISLRHSCKPNIPNSRNIGNQSIEEVIWEGRNHSMHWEEETPRKKVQDMLDALTNDLGINIVAGSNNSLSILGALGWTSTDSVINDLETLI